MMMHDSHDVRYRDPLGAVPAGASITLRFQTDEAERVEVRTWDGGETRLPMEPKGEGWFEATIQAPREPMLFWYDFILHRPEGELRYGVSYDHLGGEGAIYQGQPDSYQITVYDPEYQTPEFLRRAVIYQIFPDRFRRDANGFKGRVKKIRAAHPEASFHEDWTERPTLDVDPVTQDNRALDFFGGSLRGIAEKLDELKELGVTVLYLNPIFRARTNHRYDTGDYTQIDPVLGDDKAFDALIRAAKARGMKVMLDGVFSHTGSDSLYFNRFGRYDSLGAYQSQESPYYDWYTFDSYPDVYKTWWGFDTLPAVNKENRRYQEYLLNEEDGILPRWIRRGACGWRLDVVDELPMPLVASMRRAVKREDPDAVLLGEVWEDASNKVSYGQPRSYCLGDSLDSVMNYPLRRATIDFFTGKCDAQTLRRTILHQQETYPAPFYYSLMNLLGSHDRVRALNAMAGYDREGIEQTGREEAAGIVLTPEQRADAKKKVLEAFKLLCALPGAPTVYYGDELAMEGMADPWNRAPMDWDNGDKAMRRALKKLLNDRQSKPMLQTGYLAVEAPDADTLIVRRYAVNGRDVFGKPLSGRALSVKISR